MSAPHVTIAASPLQSYAASASVHHAFRRDNVFAMGGGATHTAQVLLTNTGRVAGAHSLLGFMSPPRPGVEGAPLQELVGFDKVHLAPGESVSVAIAVSAHDLTRTSRGGGREVDKGNWTLRIGDTRTTLEVR